MRRRLQILALSGPRLVAWYTAPIMFFILLSQMNNGRTLLSFTPRAASEIQGILARWGVSAVTEWPVFSLFMSSPDTLAECLLIALTGSLAAGVLAQLLYGFMRSVLWNGFFKDLRPFSPTVPMIDREEGIARMQDGSAAQIIGIVSGRGFRV